MRIRAIAAVAVVMATLLAGEAAAQGAGPAADGPGRLTVTGEGQVDLAPDMARFSVGVTAEDKTAAAAMAIVSERVAALLAGLAEAGVAPRDLQTGGLSLSPQWAEVVGSGGRRSRITGYLASNSVNVRVRDLAGLGALLDRALSDGANTLGGLQFGLSDPSEAENEARRRAVADARARAALFAEAAGVGLGPLLEFSEFGGRGGPVPYMAREASLASDAVPVAGGEVSVQAQVSMVYAIAQ